MNLSTGELRSHLDPRALRALKRRLMSGQITPGLFKDILRQQMVRTYFEAHPNPVMESWLGRGGRSPLQKPSRKKAFRSAGRNEGTAVPHKHF